jgi:hypothetical protein
MTLLAVFGELRKFWQNTIKPTWRKTAKPFLKVVIAAATLIIPNGFFIAFWMHRVASDYLEIGSIDFVITNPRVFFQLVGLQTGCVSLYSFLWAIVLYPRLRTWFVWWKKQ